MKHLISLILGLLIFSATTYSQAIIIDHNCTDLDLIPESAILNAKSDLHIAYDHTSHGSQLTDGMTGLIGQTNLVGYKGDIYNWNNGGTDGALDLHDYFSPVGDLGYETDWAPATRTYLDDDANSELNVIIWSWCNIYSHNIDDYLTNMETLISEYGPGGTEILNGNRTVAVTFVFMTGHTNGGITENEWTFNANKQIRQHCIDNNRILYDFYDIECYNPDGDYFGDGDANLNNYGTYNGIKDLEDDCSYNLDGGGRGNWATEWQNSHTEGVDWYTCTAAHSQSLNGNRKAYAAWWLWCRLAGWEGIVDIEEIHANNNISIYPNPVNNLITVNSQEPIHKVEIIDINGKLIKTISNNSKKTTIDVSDLKTGIYFVKADSESFKFIKH